MKHNMLQRTLSVLVMLAIMTTFFAGCQSGASQENGSTPASSGETTEETSQSEKPAGETITITGFSGMGSNQSAIEKSAWYAEYLQEELGITLEFQDAAGGNGDQIMQAMLASGELPDIVGIKDPVIATNAAGAGLLLNLDDYKDKLPSIYENDIYRHALDYNRETKPAPVDGLYLLPTTVGINNNTNYSPQLRWDLYRDMGMPEIKTTDDYLTVLRDMQSLYPQTEDGQTVYGLSIFGEWDGTNMAMATYFGALHGVDIEYVSTLMETPADGSGEPRSIFDDTSVYKKALQFYYDANQLGILDPDSITQKWDTVVDKYDAGRILFSNWEWASGGFNTKENTDVADFKGYASVWADDLTIPIVADLPTGHIWTIGVGASTKHVDEVLAFLNLYYSYEGYDYLVNGPEGVIWDTDDKGLRYITDDGWNILENNMDMPKGGKLGDARAILNGPAFTDATIYPLTGQTLGRGSWESTLLHAPTKLVSDWREQNDSAINMTFKAREQNTGQLVKSHAALQMMAPLPDELQLITSSVGDVVKTNSWQMIFAETPEDFEALWADMKAKALGLEVEKVFEWTLEEYKNAHKRVEKYTD